MENTSLSHPFQDIAFKTIAAERIGDIEKTHEQHKKIEGLIKRSFSLLEEHNTDEAELTIATASQEIEQMLQDIQKIKSVMAREHPEVSHKEEHTLSLEAKLSLHVKALADIKIQVFTKKVEEIVKEVHSFDPCPFDMYEDQEYIKRYDVYRTWFDGKKVKTILRELETLQHEVELLPPGVPPTVIEEARFKLAKAYAEKMGFITTMNIQDFQLHDEAHRIEIAKLCAERSGSVVAQHIEDFQIDPRNQTDLIEIAKLCAHGDAGSLAKNIQKFHIDQEDQTSLVKIATLCAQNNPCATARYIQNFGIRDSKDLIGIAKICIKNDEDGLIAEDIQHFPLDPDDQKTRVELAKLCAQANVRSVADHIQNFGITSPDDIVAIAMFCATQDAEATVEKLEAFDIHDPITAWQIILACIIQNRTTLNNVLESIGSLPPHHDQAFEEELQKVAKEFVSSSPEQTEQMKAWFTFTKAFILLQPTEELQDRFLEFIKQASSYRNPKQRFELLSAWVQISRRDAFHEFEALLSETPNAPSKWPSTVFLALLKSKGVTNTEAFLRGLPKRWHNEAQSLPIVLNTLHLLCQETNLSPHDISHILSVLLEGLEGKPVKELEKILCSRCRMIKGLIDNGLAHKLKLEEMGSLDLSILFQESFQEVFPAGRDRDFLRLYDATLGQFRQTDALFIYRGALERLQEPDKTECLVSLNQFVGSVLHSTFKAERYDTTKSVHLQKVMRDAELLRK